LLTKAIATLSANLSVSMQHGQQSSGAVNGAPQLASASDEAPPSQSPASRLLKLAVGLLEWAPLLVGMVIRDFKVSSTTAACLSILNLVASFVWWKLGKRRYWPETLQW